MFRRDHKFVFDTYVRKNQTRFEEYFFNLYELLILKINFMDGSCCTVVPSFTKHFFALTNIDFDLLKIYFNLI